MGEALCLDLVLDLERIVGECNDGFEVEGLAATAKIFCEGFLECKESSPEGEGEGDVTATDFVW